MKYDTVEFALWYSDSYVKESCDPKHIDFQLKVLAAEVRRLRALLEASVL